MTFWLSADMLGEAALTKDDAQKYLDTYLNAIETLGRDTHHAKSPASLSIKLSALHPRYEARQQARVMDELFASTRRLLKIARNLKVGITIDAEEVGITIDAEEADRLELSLQLFEQLYRDPVCQGWGQFGLAVQAYSKRALPALTWLAALVREQGDGIPVRLVKGAYWDTEIKLAQQHGYAGYPVYTRKARAAGVIRTTGYRRAPGAHVGRCHGRTGSRRSERAPDGRWTDHR